MLAMFSVGILAFLLVDVLGHGYEDTEAAVEAFGEDEGSWCGHALALTVLLLGGFTVGSLGIGLLERWIRSRPDRLPPMAGGATDTLVTDPATPLPAEARDATKQALRTGLFIAAAIGLHNFAEGLAIGVSAGTDEIALATVLVDWLRPAQRHRGVRDHRSARRRSAVLEVARTRRTDRGSACRHRREHWLQRRLGAARNRLLRTGRRRHPLCDRGGLAKRPALRAQGAGPPDRLPPGSAPASSPTSWWRTRGAEPGGQLVRRTRPLWTRSA